MVPEGQLDSTLATTLRLPRIIEVQRANQNNTTQVRTETLHLDLRLGLEDLELAKLDS